MGFRLSICIPTYNRAGLLRETLESIVGQARTGLEIVICDNASTDATPQLVEEFRERFPAIHYFRWPENMGFDRNILKTVEEAHGDYCWLMGDDDHLEEGALERLFPLLEEGYGCIYVNASTYDREMTRCSGETIRRFACADADQTLLSIASWLTFVSSICVRRADFLKHLDGGIAHVGSGFAHCYPLVSVIRHGRNHIVREPLVRFRAGNTGGYNIFRMFIEEFGRILSYCGELGYSPGVLEEVRTRNVYLVMVPAIIQIKLGELNLKADSVLHYLAGSGLGLKERLLLAALVGCPAFFFRLVHRARRALRQRS